MPIEKIVLENFRNFRNKVLEFSKRATVIVGPNASGKTNILESIFLLSTGKSFRARLEEEMVSYDSSITRVSAEVGTMSNKVRGESENHNSEIMIHSSKLEVVLTRGKIEVGDSKFEKVPRKKLLVNGIPRHLYNFAGNLEVVLFGPWDMDLVTESPSVRRKFLDNVLSLTDREYRRSILSYEKGLRQRNKLLLKIREEGLSRSSLLFWDQLLIKNGDLISQKRQSFIDFVNKTKDFNGQDFSLDYDKSIISEGRLEQYKEEEVAAATSLVGPHRDDFVFKINNRFSKNRRNSSPRELARYGSRGEQRMGVLWLKLAELAFVKEATGEMPTLLLDDIFSELDHLHRDMVMDVIGNQQTIITTADEHFVENFEKSDLIRLNDGRNQI